MLWLVIKSYLLGSIPFSYLLAQFWRKIDIRKLGSHNVGATNVVKEAGIIPGLLAGIGDGVKGLIAVLMGSALGSGGECLALILAMVGHNWPIWLGFHGGGGLATFIGGMLIISKWWVILILLAIWGLAYLIVREHNRSALIACSLSPVVLGYLHSSWRYFLLGVGAAFVVGIKRFTGIKAEKTLAL